MAKPLMKVYEGTVLRHPLLTVLFFVLLSVAMAAGLRTFKIDASADSLTLEHDSDLDYFRELNQRYGSSDVLVVTYEPKGVALFSDESLQVLKSLTEDLAEIPGVEGVQSIVSAPLLFSPRVDISELGETPRTLLTPGVDKEDAIRELHNSPIYKDLMVGPDNNITGIFATLTGDSRYLELVRKRDRLREKQDSGQLSPSEKDELALVTTEFRQYSTQVASENYQRVQTIRNLMAKYRDKAELHLGGPTMITADIVDYVAGDLVTFGTGVLVFIIFTLALIFRQLRWVVLPLAACALAVVIVLGWLSWIDWRLTVISSNFVAVLLIISMALTIHLVVRYRELHWKHPDRDQVELVAETVRSMVRPCLYTVLTTLVAFASLVVSDIRPVIDFGWMMTIGLLVSFVLIFAVIPAGILLWGKQPVRHRSSEDHPYTLYFSRFTECHGGMVLAISALVAIASVVGISRLEVDNRFIDYFHKDTEIYQGLSVIDKNLGGTTPLEIVIRKKESESAGDSGPTEHSSAGQKAEVQGSEEGPYGGTDPFASASPGEDPFGYGDDPFAAGGESAGSQGAASSYWFTRAGLDRLEKLHEFLEGMPEIGKVNSPVTAYQVANQLTGHKMNDFELAFMRRSLSPGIRDFLLTPYLDDEKGEARFSLRAVETASDMKRQELLRQIDNFLREEMGLEPDQYRFSGLMVLYNNMLQSLFKSQILTLGAVFLGIMTMFLVLFRSFKVSIIAIVPNILAAGSVLGGMGLVGIPLDMMTITIAAITVGIGVDDTIHYIHRFGWEFAEDHNYLAAMHRAHGSIGKAMYYTSVIIIAGFSILTLSNFIPTIYFGALTGVAMLMALLGALALLPKLILIFKPFGPEAENATAS